MKRKQPRDHLPDYCRPQDRARRPRCRPNINKIIPGDILVEIFNYTGLLNILPVCKYWLRLCHERFRDPRRLIIIPPGFNWWKTEVNLKLKYGDEYVFIKYMHQLRGYAKFVRHCIPGDQIIRCYINNINDFSSNDNDNNIDTDIMEFFRPYVQEMLAGTYIPDPAGIAKFLDKNGYKLRTCYRIGGDMKYMLSRGHFDDTFRYDTHVDKITFDLIKSYSLKSQRFRESSTHTLDYIFDLMEKIHRHTEKLNSERELKSIFELSRHERKSKPVFARPREYHPKVTKNNSNRPRYRY